MNYVRALPLTFSSPPLGRGQGEELVSCFGDIVTNEMYAPGLQAMGTSCV
jgi:hypothetical protein